MPAICLFGGLVFYSFSSDLFRIPQFDGGDISILSENEDDVTTPPNYPIPVIKTNRYKSRKRSHLQKNHINHKNLKTIKRSNKNLQALDLPSVINLNPRSIYNKKNEFHTLVNELSVSLIFMSESWERENETLDEIIELENYEVISNHS